MRDRIHGRTQSYKCRLPRWAAWLAAMASAVLLCWPVVPSATAQLPDEPPLVPAAPEKAPDVQPPDTEAAGADAEGQADIEADAKGQADAKADVEAEAEAGVEKEADIEAEADAKAKTEAGADVGARGKVEAGAGAEAEAGVDEKAEVEGEAEAGAEAGADPQAEVDADRDAQTHRHARVGGRIGVQFDAESDRLMITQVESGSLATRAGLRAHDEIVAINGRRVSSAEDFDLRLQAAARAGGSAGLFFWRDDELHQVQVAFAAEPDYRLGRRRVTYFRGPDGQTMPPPSLDTENAVPANGSAGPVYDDDYTPTRYRRAQRARNRCW